MTNPLLAVVVLAAAWAAYTYLGYPVLVWALARRRPPTAPPEPGTPHVALVISAYNEAETIRAKLDNALGLDYPRERLEIWVSSDGSTDGTDAIVRAVARSASQVRLVAHPENRGKTAALMATVDRLDAAVEAVVFSDANALYELDAVRLLVRHFADASVGAVAGELRYTDSGPEAMYRRYENWIKRSESRLGTCILAEGSIFAARRELVPRLAPDHVEDLAIPLSIALRGYRVVYEDAARSHETFALTTRAQFRRRRRIVNRSVRTLAAFQSALNPLRSGRLALMLLSHRVMRWFAPVVIAIGLAAGVAATSPRFLLLATVAIVAPAVVFRRALSLLTGFVVANAAIVAGLLSVLRGTSIATWTPDRAATTLGSGPR